MFHAKQDIIVSNSEDKSIRVWDVSTGAPRPSMAHAMVSGSEQMQFSPDGRSLALNSGRRVSILNVATWKMLAEIELGETHAAMAFADNDHLYLGAESGTLRVLASDRSGSWNLRNVWQGPSAIRKLGISPQRQQLVLVNAVINAFRLVDHIVVMTRGGPDNATALLLYYIYEVAFTFQDSAYAATLTVVLLVVLSTLALIKFGYLDRRIHYQ